MSIQTSRNRHPSKRKTGLSENAQGVLLMIGTFTVITLMFVALHIQEITAL